MRYWADKEIQLLKENYKRKSARKISEKILDRSIEAIRKKAMRLGLKAGVRRKYPINFELFKELIPESAYWLGFIYADGCIFKSKNSWSLQIELTAKDLNHLKKLRDILSLRPIQKKETHKTIFPSRGNAAKNYRSVVLKVTSTKLINQLKKLGVTQRKSLKNTFPEIPEKFYPDFIRGYLDGDGCIGIIERNYKRFYIQIEGTKAFLTRLDEIIREKLDINPDSEVRKRYPDGNIFEINYYGSYNSKIAKWLYYDKDVTCLERKREIWKAWKNLPEKEKSCSNYKLWQPNEIEILRENRGKITAKEIQEKYFQDRTLASITNKITRLED